MRQRETHTHKGIGIGRKIERETHTQRDRERERDTDGRTGGRTDRDVSPRVSSKALRSNDGTVKNELSLNLPRKPYSTLHAVWQYKKREKRLWRNWAIMAAYATVCDYCAAKPPHMNCVSLQQ